MKPLILASQSPRRKAILAAAGLVFEVIPASPDAESSIPHGAAAISPAEFVKLQARAKATDVANQLAGRDCIVLGCDTVAVCHGQILGKPADRDDARRMLRMLSGSVHLAISGICLKNPADPAFERLDAVTTELSMAPLSDATLEAYLDTGIWQGKAGAFGYQDGNDWLRILSGSESNVVGLPLERLMELLTYQPQA